MRAMNKKLDFYYHLQTLTDSICRIYFHLFLQNEVYSETGLSGDLKTT